MGSLLNKHGCDPDGDDSVSKSRRVAWRNVGRNNSRTSSNQDDSPRLRRRVSKYMLSRHYSKYRAAKRLRRYRLRRRKYDRAPKTPRRRYRLRSGTRRRRKLGSVGKRRTGRRSQQRPRKRSLNRVKRRGGGRKRKRGRPRKNEKSRVYRKKRRNSAAKKRNEEDKRHRRDFSRDKRSVMMREVGTRRDVERVFKPQDRVKRRDYNKGVDDIQENPLSARKRCSLLVSSIPGIPFDGRKRDEKTNDKLRNKSAKMRGVRQRYSRQHSANKRRYRRTASVNQRCRKPRVYRDRNRNALQSLPRLTNQVTYWQTGAGEFNRPKKTKNLSISSLHGRSDRICHQFLCPCTRQDLETSRSLSSRCCCCCCWMPDFGTSRGEAGDISLDRCCCCHCYRLGNLTLKRHATVNNRQRRKTKCRSNTDLKTGSRKNTI